MISPGANQLLRFCHGKPVFNLNDSSDQVEYGEIVPVQIQGRMAEILAFPAMGVTWWKSHFLGKGWNRFFLDSQRFVSGVRPHTVIK